MIVQKGELFGRRARVSIISYDVVKGTKVLRTDKILKVQDLRVAFQVTKTWQPAPNPAKIRIYNLSPDSRAYIESKYAYLTLEAGYGARDAQLPVLFEGDIAQVDTLREGPDIITEISAGDGEFYYGRKAVSFSFGPGTKVGQLFDAAIEKFGFKTGVVKGLDRTKSLNNGMAFSGLARDFLAQLLGSQKLEYSIQDNAIHVLPETVASDDPVVNLNLQTGLIGTPQKTRILRQDQAKKQNGQVAESGVKFTCLLNGDLKVNHPVRIFSENVNGQFKVRNLSHSGDTHAADWQTQGEAV